MTINNDCIRHLTANGIKIGENAARPPIPHRRNRSPTLAAAVKVAKRAGADRVEIDQKSGRIVIPLTARGPSIQGTPSWKILGMQFCPEALMARIKLKHVNSFFDR